MPHRKTKVRSCGCKLSITLPEQPKLKKDKKESKIESKTKSVQNPVNFSTETMHDPVTGKNYTSINENPLSFARDKTDTTQENPTPFPATLNCSGKKIRIHNKWDHDIWYKAFANNEFDVQIDQPQDKIEKGEKKDIGYGLNAEGFSIEIYFCKDSNYSECCIYYADFSKGAKDCDFVKQYSGWQNDECDISFKIDTTDTTTITFNVEKK